MTKHRGDGMQRERRQTHEATIGVGSGLQCRRTPNTIRPSILGTVVGIVARTLDSLLKYRYCAALVGGQAFSSACLWGRACLGLACFLLAPCARSTPARRWPLLERFLPPREGLLDLRAHGLHGWISTFSRWDATPRARAGSMPGGRDSGPLLPLMKLPRIAYRKSIKPSQIIPPSRQPVHQPGATISPLGGDSCRTSSPGWGWTVPSAT